jgi:hypothetical protein
MLGVARFMDPCNRHFRIPRGTRSLTRAKDEGWTRLKPVYAEGAVMYHDPFPSLIIQDEGHLLEVSLGTFSGLFETAFEGILTRLGSVSTPEESASVSRSNNPSLELARKAANGFGQ